MQMACYDGAADTVGIGECEAGMKTCLPDGMGYGPCDGQVVNAAVDDCKTPLFDENCDGVANDGCPAETLAIVAAEPAATSAEEVRVYLTNTQKFALINVYDAAVGTPTITELQQHTAVLVFSNKIFADPVALGDVVADYYDAGGRVVLAMFSVQGAAGTRIQGRFGGLLNGYLLINPEAALGGPASDGLGEVIEPLSPLMQGVSAFDATGTFRSIGGTINGGTIVAKWSSGYPLIVRGVVKGRNRVDVNFYPPATQAGSPQWTGNGAEMIRNALLF